MKLSSSRGLTQEGDKTQRCEVQNCDITLVKYRNFNYFPNAKILWKLRGNRAFLQNFRTRKLGEITGFYAV